MCNYSEYKKIISEEIGEKIPTGKEIERVGEIARRYFVDGGAGGVLVALGVGVRVITKEYFTKELNETISRRLCFVSGGRAGEELTIHDIFALGDFLPGGAFFGMVAQI